MKGEVKEGKIPKYWDGRTAERIVFHLRKLKLNGKSR